MDSYNDSNFDEVVHHVITPIEYIFRVLGFSLNVEVVFNSKPSVYIFHF